MTLTEHDDGTDQPQHDKVVPLEYMLEVVVNPITGRGGSAPKMKLSTNYRRTRKGAIAESLATPKTGSREPRPTTSNVYTH